MNETISKNKDAVAARRIAGLKQHSEKVIERRLVVRCTQHGLICLKYSNANDTGLPDRLVLLPGGRVHWVELKSTGCKPTKLQTLQHDRLRAAGHEVTVVDTLEGVDALIDSICNGCAL